MGEWWRGSRSASLPLASGWVSELLRGWHIVRLCVGKGALGEQLGVGWWAVGE